VRRFTPAPSRARTYPTQLATTANARTTLVKAQGTLQNDRVAFATALGLAADTDVLPATTARASKRRPRRPRCPHSPVN
jgi:outer membrane protein TolC